jgi:hypothetical protein
MSTQTLAQEPTSTRPARLRFRLSRTPRRAVLVLHVLASAAWIGIDVLVAVLVVAGRVAPDVRTRGLAYEALGTFVVAPMLVAGLVCLVTGVVLGLGTPYGLVRSWWVLVKLVINVVLCTLIVVALAPGMAEVAAHGQALVDGASSSTDVSQLAFPPAVSLSALSLATWLSVFKPWGRIRRSVRPTDRRGDGSGGGRRRGAPRTP